MRALVTGATGFVGPHLCAHLAACGDEAIDPGDNRTGFDITDPEAVTATFARLEPEVVYHLAALSDVAGSWGNRSLYLRVNIEGTSNVLQAAAATGVRRVLVVGSSEEYGRVDPGALPVGEDAPLQPVTPYGATKVAAGYLALQAWLGSQLETIRVRPFGHTGPGQSPAFFVPGFAGRVAAAEREGRDVITAGSLDPVRDISDVRDVVRAYRLLMDLGEPGAVYNVCSGTGVAIGDIADRLLSMAERPMRIETDPALVRPADAPRLVGDASRLRATTGYEPSFSLDDTLAAVLAEARARA